MIQFVTLPNIILMIFLIIFFLTLLSLYKQDKNIKEKWEWKQLISEPDGTASQTKVMQLIGSITGTFIVIYQTVQNSLMAEVFVAYLAALGMSAGFSNWLRSKNTYYNDNSDYDNRRYNHDDSISDEEVEEFKRNNRNL